MSVSGRGARSARGRAAGDPRRERADGRGHRSRNGSTGRPPLEVRRPATTITINDQHAGRRLDKFLRSQLKGVPAGLLFQLLRKGRLRVNGRKAEQNYRLVEGDVVTIPPLTVETPGESTPRPSSAHLDRLRDVVLHEDADLLVMDKPAGMAVHKGTGNPFGVIELMRHLRPDLPELELGHRLDRDTSGVLALAKTPTMLRHLHGLLRDREDEIGRHYLAIVAGHLPDDMAVLDAPLLRRDAEVVVHPDGQRAETRVEVRRRVADRATLVGVRLLTGRRHQIRVHLSHAGHPIAGDERYGDPRFNAQVASRGGRGLHLHAGTMVIPLPDGAELTVTAPMPREWERLIDTGL